MTKPKCKYGDKCYRRNPKHLEEFDHDGAPSPQSGDDHDDSPSEQEARSPLKPSHLTETSPKKELPLKRKEPGSKQTTIQGFFKKQKTEQSESSKQQAEVSKTDTTANKRGMKYDAESDEEKEARFTPKTVKLKKRVSEKKQSQPKAAAEEASEQPKPEVLDVLRSCSDVRALSKDLLRVELPQDFYDLWEFVTSKDSGNPCDVFLATAGVRLTGPYDLFWVSDVEGMNWLCHSRYYYDPPELMTTMKTVDGSQFHLGYFRDDPSEAPVFVASNDADVDGKLTCRGGNIFSAIKWLMESKKSSQPAFTKLLKSLSVFAEEKGHDLSAKTAAMKARDKKVVTKTFHTSGLVVPVDANEVGYRELPHSPAELRTILEKIQRCKNESDRDKAMDPLMETIMLVQFANDEGDYGEGVELGLDLFTFGDSFLHGQVVNLLPLGYRLLKRDLYADIVEAHLKNRKRKL